jgi:hypothetical protein
MRSDRQCWCMRAHSMLQLHLLAYRRKNAGRVALACCVLHKQRLHTTAHAAMPSLLCSDHTRKAARPPNSCHKAAAALLNESILVLGCIAQRFGNMLRSENRPAHMPFGCHLLKNDTHKLDNTLPVRQRASQIVLVLMTVDGHQTKATIKHRVHTRSRHLHVRQA